MAYETSSSEAGRASAPTGLGDDALRASDDLSGAAAAAASEAKAAARNLRDKVTAGAEQARNSAAEGLESASSAMHSGGERVARAAHRAGDALAHGAAYVRRNEITDMLEDVADLVRDNPGPALVCAAALGFMLGRAFYRH
jgi:ElaB/YqjD/DUF883 family membrane-anchored ribosome-binding protein